MSNRRFVAHIDILGMANLIKSDAESAWKLLTTLADCRDDVLEYEITFIDTAERAVLAERVKCLTFSDTILLYTLSDKLVDLRSIVWMTAQILNLSLSGCVPIRAGISLGVFFVNEERSMYAGPALVDAYTIGENAQRLGIVVSPEVYYFPRASEWKSGVSDIFVRYGIPTKGAVVDGFAVNWPAVYAKSYVGEIPVQADAIYSGFVDSFGPYEKLDNAVKLKYENTATFMTQMLQMPKLDPSGEP